MSALTSPNSVRSTTFIVASSVTRSPFTPPGLDIRFLEPPVDGRTAAVDDDRFDANRFHKDDVLEHCIAIVITISVRHRAAPVLDDHDLAAKGLDVGQGLDEHSCLVDVLLQSFHSAFRLESGDTVRRVSHVPWLHTSAIRCTSCSASRTVREIKSIVFSPAIVPMTSGQAIWSIASHTLWA